MVVDGDVRVVPNSKRVADERWARVGLMRPLLALLGGWGVASSSFRRVSLNSLRSSSRSARSCLTSSSRAADAPAPMAAVGLLPLVVQFLGCAGLPLLSHGVGSMPAEGCVVADARVAPLPALGSALELPALNRMGEATRGTARAAC